MAKNGQVTIRKSTRELFGIETGDIIFLEVRKIMTPEGELKYVNDGIIVPLNAEKE